MAGGRREALNLEGILSGVWDMLDRGARAWRDPLHRGVLATIGTDGPEARWIILRHADAGQRLVACHSDLRSRKIQELERNMRSTWLFYHPRRRIQLRLTGATTLHADDAAADAAWAQAGLGSRLGVAAREAPGTVVAEPTSGFPDWFLSVTAPELDGPRFRRNFCLLSCRVACIDWLKLGVLGHRRARFSWRDGRWESSWLVP